MNLDEFLKVLAEIKDVLASTDNANDLSLACNKFYQVLFEVLKGGKGLSDESKIVALSSALEIFTPLRLKCKVIDHVADALGHFIFMECARLVLDIKFIQLDEDFPEKSKFHQVLDASVADFRVLPVVGPMFSLLQRVMEQQWNEPTLSAMMNGEDVNAETALEYIQSKEYPELLKLRVDMLLENGCESLALHLCSWMVRSAIFESDASVRQIQLLLLHKLGKHEEFHSACLELPCCIAVEVLQKSAQKSIPEDDDVELIMAQTFLIHDWMKSTKYCCTKKLLCIWLEKQREAEPDTEVFTNNVVKISLLAENSKQHTIMLESMLEKFSDEFLQFCTDVALKAVRLDRHRLDSARTYTKNEKETDAAAASLANICKNIALLYSSHWQMKLACSMAAFYLEPKVEQFKLLEEMLQHEKDPFGLKMMCPKNVDYAVYAELFEMMESLRPSKMDPRLGWDAVKRAAVSHLEEVGFMFDSKSNSFINLAELKLKAKLKTEKGKQSVDKSKPRAIKSGIAPPPQQFAKITPPASIVKVAAPPRPNSAVPLPPSAMTSTQPKPQPVAGIKCSSIRDEKVVKVPKTQIVGYRQSKGVKHDINVMGAAQPTSHPAQVPSQVVSSTAVGSVRPPVPKVNEPLQQQQLRPSSQVVQVLPQNVPKANPVQRNPRLQGYGYTNSIPQTSTSAATLQHKPAAKQPERLRLPNSSAIPPMSAPASHTTQPAAVPSKLQNVTLDEIQQVLSTQQQEAGSIKTNPTPVDEHKLKEITAFLQDGLYKEAPSKLQGSSPLPQPSLSISHKHSQATATQHIPVRISRGQQLSPLLPSRTLPNYLGNHTHQGNCQVTLASAHSHTTCTGQSKQRTPSNHHQPSQPLRQLQQQQQPTLLQQPPNVNLPLTPKSGNSVQSPSHSASLSIPPTQVVSAGGFPAQMRPAILSHHHHQQQLPTSHARPLMPAPSTSSSIHSLQAVCASVQPAQMLSQAVSVNVQPAQLHPQTVSSDSVQSSQYVLPQPHVQSVQKMQQQVSIHVQPPQPIVSVNSVQTAHVVPSVQAMHVQQPIAINVQPLHVQPQVVSVNVQPAQAPSPQMVSVRNLANLQVFNLNVVPSSSQLPVQPDSPQVDASAIYQSSANLHNPAASPKAAVQTSVECNTSVSQPTAPPFTLHSTMVPSSTLLAAPKQVPKSISVQSIPTSSLLSAVVHIPPASSSPAISTPQRTAARAVSSASSSSCATAPSISTSSNALSGVSSSVPTRSVQRDLECAQTTLTGSKPFPNLQLSPQVKSVNPIPSVSSQLISSSSVTIPNISTVNSPKETVVTCSPNAITHPSKDQLDAIASPSPQPDVESGEKAKDAVPQTEANGTKAAEGMQDTHLNGFKCKYCDECFESLPQRHRHQEWLCKQKLGELPAECSSPSSQDDPSFFCDHCNKEFPDGESLSMHVKRAHTVYEDDKDSSDSSGKPPTPAANSIELYMCEICGKLTKTKSGKTQHMHRVHGYSITFEEIRSLGIKTFKPRSRSRGISNDAEEYEVERPCRLRQMPRPSYLESSDSEESQSLGVVSTAESSETENPVQKTDSVGPPLLKKCFVKLYPIDEKQLLALNRMTDFKEESGSSETDCGDEKPTVVASNVVDCKGLLLTKAADMPSKTPFKDSACMCEMCGELLSSMGFEGHACRSAPLNMCPISDIPVSISPFSESPFSDQSASPASVHQEIGISNHKQTTSPVKKKKPQQVAGPRHNRSEAKSREPAAQPEVIPRSASDSSIVELTKFLCSKCYKTFESKGECSQHQAAEEHQAAKIIEYFVYKCKFCDALYLTADSVLKHLLLKCSKSPQAGKSLEHLDPTLCCLCKQSCPGASAMEKHLMGQHKVKNPSKVLRELGLVPKPEESTQDEVRSSSPQKKNAGLTAASGVMKLSHGPLDDSIQTDVMPGDFADLVQFVSDNVEMEPQMDQEGKLLKNGNCQSTPETFDELLSAASLQDLDSGDEASQDQSPVPQSGDKAQASPCGIEVHRNVTMDTYRMAQCLKCSQRFHCCDVEDHERLCGAKFPRKYSTSYGCPYCYLIFATKTPCVTHQFRQCLRLMGFDIAEIKQPQIPCPENDCVHKFYTAKSLALHLCANHRLTEEDSQTAIASMRECGMIMDVNGQIPLTIEQSQRIDDTLNTVSQTTQVSKTTLFKNVSMRVVPRYKCDICCLCFAPEEIAEHKEGPCGPKAGLPGLFTLCHVHECPHCLAVFHSRNECWDHQVTNCLPKAGLDTPLVHTHSWPCPWTLSSGSGCLAKLVSPSALSSHLKQEHRCPAMLAESISKQYEAANVDPKHSRMAPMKWDALIYKNVLMFHQTVKVSAVEENESSDGSSTYGKGHHLFICPFCHSTFGSNDLCLIHTMGDCIQKSGLDSGTLHAKHFTCAQCSAAFFHEGELLQHQMERHDSQKKSSHVASRPKAHKNVGKDKLANASSPKGEPKAKFRGILFQNILMLSTWKVQCKKCETLLTTKKIRKRHFESCGPNYPIFRFYTYACPYCQQIFRTKSDCRNHQLEVCLKERGYDTQTIQKPHLKCPIVACKKLVYDGIDLKHHLRMHHSAKSDAIDRILDDLLEQGILGKNLESQVWDDKDDNGSSAFVLESSILRAGSFPSTNEISNSHTTEGAVNPDDHPAPTSAVLNESLSYGNPQGSSHDVTSGLPKTVLKKNLASHAAQEVIHRNLVMWVQVVGECKECNSCLYSKDEFKNHAKSDCRGTLVRHHAYQCPHCENDFSNKQACYQHQLTNCLKNEDIEFLKKKRLYCPLCGLFVYDPVPLKGHLHKVHQLQASIIDHVIGYMGALPKQWCQVQKDILMADQLELQELVHSCSDCGMVTVSLNLLHFHREFFCQSHSSIVPDAPTFCDVCGENFLHPVALVFHSYSHGNSTAPDQVEQSNSCCSTLLDEPVSSPAEVPKERSSAETKLEATVFGQTECKHLTDESIPATGATADAPEQENGIIIPTQHVHDSNSVSCFQEAESVSPLPVTGVVSKNENGEDLSTVSAKDGSLDVNSHSTDGMSHSPVSSSQPLEPELAQTIESDHNQSTVTAKERIMDNSCYSSISGNHSQAEESISHLSEFEIAVKSDSGDNQSSESVKEGDVNSKSPSSADDNHSAANESISHHSEIIIAPLDDDFRDSQSSVSAEGNGMYLNIHSPSSDSHSLADESIPQLPEIGTSPVLTYGGDDKSAELAKVQIINVGDLPSSSETGSVCFEDENAESYDQDSSVANAERADPMTNASGSASSSAGISQESNLIGLEFPGADHGDESGDEGNVTCPSPIVLIQERGSPACTQREDVAPQQDPIEVAPIDADVVADMSLSQGVCQTEIVNGPQNLSQLTHEMNVRDHDTVDDSPEASRDGISCKSDQMEDSLECIETCTYVDIRPISDHLSSSVSTRAAESSNDVCSVDVATQVEEKGAIADVASLELAQSVISSDAKQEPSVDNVDIAPEPHSENSCEVDFIPEPILVVKPVAEEACDSELESNVAPMNIGNLENGTVTEASKGEGEIGEAEGSKDEETASEVEPCGEPGIQEFDSAAESCKEETDKDVPLPETCSEEVPARKPRENSHRDSLEKDSDDFMNGKCGEIQSSDIPTEPAHKGSTNEIRVNTTTPMRSGNVLQHAQNETIEDAGMRLEIPRSLDTNAECKVENDPVTTDTDETNPRVVAQAEIKVIPGIVASGVTHEIAPHCKAMPEVVTDQSDQEIGADSGNLANLPPQGLMSFEFQNHPGEPVNAPVQGAVPPADEVIEVQDDRSREKADGIINCKCPSGYTSSSCQCADDDLSEHMKLGAASGCHKYVCAHCEKTTGFSSEYSFRSHLLWVHRIRTNREHKERHKLLSCPLCKCPPQKFETEASLQCHMKWVHGVRNFQAIESVPRKNQALKEEDEKKGTKEGGDSSPVDKHTDSHIEMAGGIAVKENEPSPPLDQSGKELGTKHSSCSTSEEDKTRNKHDAGTIFPVTCHLCSEEYARKEDLQDHLVGVHGATLQSKSVQHGLWTCPCGETCSDYQTFLSHVAKTHNKPASNSLQFFVDVDKGLSPPKSPVALYHNTSKAAASSTVPNECSSNSDGRSAGKSQPKSLTHKDGCLKSSIKSKAKSHQKSCDTSRSNRALWEKITGKQTVITKTYSKKKPMASERIVPSEWLPTSSAGQVAPCTVISLLSSGREPAIEATSKASPVPITPSTAVAASRATIKTASASKGASAQISCPPGQATRTLQRPALPRSGPIQRGSSLPPSHRPLGVQHSGGMSPRGVSLRGASLPPAFPKASISKPLTQSSGGATHHVVSKEKAPPSRGIAVSGEGPKPAPLEPKGNLKLDLRGAISAVEAVPIKGDVISLAPKDVTKSAKMLFAGSGADAVKKNDGNKRAKGNEEAAQVKCVAKNGAIAEKSKAGTEGPKTGFGQAAATSASQERIVMSKGKDEKSRGHKEPADEMSMNSIKEKGKDDGTESQKSAKTCRDIESKKDSQVKGRDEGGQSLKRGKEEEKEISDKDMKDADKSAKPSKSYNEVKDTDGKRLSSVKQDVAKASKKVTDVIVIDDDKDSVASDVELQPRAHSERIKACEKRQSKPKCIIINDDSEESKDSDSLMMVTRSSNLRKPLVSHAKQSASLRKRPSARGPSEPPAKKDRSLAKSIPKTAERPSTRQDKAISKRKSNEASHHAALKKQKMDRRQTHQPQARVLNLRSSDRKTRQRR